MSGLIAQLVIVHGRRANGRYLVNCSDLMARANVARINFVIVEIFAAQRAGFIPNQTIFSYLAGVELYLNFHIVRDWL